jgi:hypothetical protein
VAVVRETDREAARRVLQELGESPVEIGTVADAG